MQPETFPRSQPGTPEVVHRAIADLAQPQHGEDVRPEVGGHHHAEVAEARQQREHGGLHRPQPPVAK